MLESSLALQIYLFSPATALFPLVSGLTKLLLCSAVLVLLPTSVLAQVVYKLHPLLAPSLFVFGLAQGVLSTTESELLPSYDQASIALFTTKRDDIIKYEVSIFIVGPVYLTYTNVMIRILPIFQCR